MLKWLMVVPLASLVICVEKCTTPNNEAASCISLFACPVLLSSLVSQNPTSISFYRQSTCGGTPSEPLVCCGSSSNFTAQEGKQCFTPNSEQATCTSLFSCPTLTAALAERNSTTVQFYQQSVCGGTAANPLVCCGSSASFAPGQDRIQGTATAMPGHEDKMNLLPSKKVCGLQHADDYFRGENDSSIRITEFPWLAAIRYPKRKGSTVTAKCGGSLINSRYVLTAAHCLQNPVHVPNAVLLGEYDDTAETDCVKESQFEEECSEPLQIFDVEKIIVYPGYKFGKHENDIGLIRLNKTVRYNDYVRPICLPFPGTKVAEPGAILRSSGWGRVGNAKNSTDAAVKKRVLGRLMSNAHCSERYYDAQINVQITEKHLCTSSQNITTDFDCVGDSGGPLVFAHKSQWHQEGISSFGARECGSQYPDVYTRVSEYLDWILENIEK